MKRTHTIRLSVSRHNPYFDFSEIVRRTRDELLLQAIKEIPLKENVVMNLNFSHEIDKSVILDEFLEDIVLTMRCESEVVLDNPPLSFPDHSGSRLLTIDDLDDVIKFLREKVKRVRGGHNDAVSEAVVSLFMLAIKMKEGAGDEN